MMCASKPYVVTLPKWTIDIQLEFHCINGGGKIFNQENPYGRVDGWVDGWVGGFFQEIFPLRGSILQAGTCQILSLAKNPRWSRVWQ